MKSSHIFSRRKGLLSFPLVLILVLSITLIKMAAPVSAQSTEIAVINPKNPLNPAAKDGNFMFYTNTTSLNDKFNATLWIFNYGTPPVFAWQVRLNYNSTLLNITRAWTGQTLLDPNYIFFGRSPINPAPALGVGTILLADSLLVGTGETPPPNPAFLATIEFQIMSAPTSGKVSTDLDINNEDTYLLDDNLDTIVPTKTSGYYEYSWLEPGLEVRQSKYDFTVLETFNVMVWLNNVTSSDSLVSLEFRLRYNTTLLQTSVVNVTEGPFIKQFGTTIFSPQVNITGGYVEVNITFTSIPPPSYPIGSGAISNITFDGIYQDSKENECLLELFDVQLLDNNRNPMPTTPPINGRYKISPSGGSVITTNVNPASVTAGSVVTINGTITPTKINANVTIHYRLIGEATWTNLTTVKTDSNSHYTYAWTATKKTTSQTDDFEFKASWPGDATTNGDESDAPYPTLEINRESSTITINVTPLSSKVGSDVTISGQITPIKSGIDVTLYYSFMNGANITLDTTKTNLIGSYTYSWTIPKAGDFSFYADWPGDTKTAGDKSDIASTTASKGTSTITISVQPTTVEIGSDVTISGAITPTKIGVNVTIQDSVGGDLTTLTKVKTDSNGAYTYTWKTTKSGSHQLKASWNGDDASNWAESITKTVTVRLPSSTITINADPKTVTTGSTVAISGDITPAKIGVNVTIYYRLNETGEAWSNLTTVKTGSDSFYTYTWTTNKTGTFEFKASWPGDNTNEAAESQTILVKVEEQNPILAYIPYIIVGIAIIIIAAVALYLLKIRKR